MSMRHGGGLLAFGLLVQGCSSDSTASPGPDGSSADAVVADTGAAVDTGTQTDSPSAADTSAIDGSAQDAGAEAGADDSSTDAAGDVAVADGGGEGGCPASWMMAPAVDPSIALPDGGGSVLLHASATGTQNYMCTQSDGGFGWTFVGPEAELHDCTSAVVGHHFASDGGAAAPEWQTNDGTYVVGKRSAAFVPDGGATSIAWLLLQGTAHGGTGALSRAGYIQRLSTDGGLAPSITCDQSVVGGGQASQKVPYTADYYFFGQ